MCLLLVTRSETHKNSELKFKYFKDNVEDWNNQEETGNEYILVTAKVKVNKDMAWSSSKRISRVFAIERLAVRDPLSSFGTVFCTYVLILIIP